jgi:hypothetical protein
MTKKDVGAAKNFLKSAKDATDNDCFHKPQVRNGVQYFCNTYALVALDDGYHLPFDAYELKPDEKALDFEQWLLAPASDSTAISCDIIKILAQVKEWNANGEKKLGCRIGNEEKSIVVNPYFLKWVTAMLGKNPKYYIGNDGITVYIKSERGRALIVGIKKAPDWANGELGVFPDRSDYTYKKE